MLGVQQYIPYIGTTVYGIISRLDADSAYMSSIRFRSSPSDEEDPARRNWISLGTSFHITDEIIAFRNNLLLPSYKKALSYFSLFKSQTNVQFQTWVRSMLSDCIQNDLNEHTLLSNAYHPNW